MDETNGAHSLLAFFFFLFMIAFYFLQGRQCVLESTKIKYRSKKISPGNDVALYELLFGPHKESLNHYYYFAATLFVPLAISMLPFIISSFALGTNALPTDVTLSVEVQAADRLAKETQQAADLAQSVLAATELAATVSEPTPEIQNAVAAALEHVVATQVAADSAAAALIAQKQIAADSLVANENIKLINRYLFATIIIGAYLSILITVEFGYLFYNKHIHQRLSQLLVIALFLDTLTFTVIVLAGIQIESLDPSALNVPNQASIWLLVATSIAALIASTIVVVAVRTDKDSSHV